MKIFLKYLLLGTIIFSFSGCEAFINAISIGKTKTKAEEEGLDYQDTGALAGPYFLYKNRKDLNQAVLYPNSNCREAVNEKKLINGDE